MDCIFCKIIKKENPSDIVYEDDEVLAFNDIDPKAPTHILAIPKQHVTSIADLKDMGVADKLLNVLKNLAKEKGLNESGYRIVVNHGKQGGQAVFHLHFHLLGGRQMSWPPG